MLIALLVTIVISSVSISATVVTAITDRDDEGLQTERSQIINNTNNIISTNDGDLLKVQILADGLEKRIEDAAALLEITAKSPDIRSIPNASLLNATLEALNGIPEYSDIERRTVAKDIISNINSDITAMGFIMPNGDLYLVEPYSRQENRTSNNLAFRDYFVGVLNTNDTFLEVIVSGSSGQRQINIAVPVFSQDKTLAGIWVGGINPSVFDLELQSLNLPGEQRIVYINSNGTKIADSDNISVTNTSETFVNLTSFQRAIGGDSGSIVEEINHEEMGITYYPVEALNDRWAVLWMQSLNRSNNSNSFESGRTPG